MNTTNEVTVRKDQEMRDNMDDVVEIRGLDALMETQEHLGYYPSPFGFEVRSSGLVHRATGVKTSGGWALSVCDAQGDFLPGMSMGGPIDSPGEVVFYAKVNIGRDRRCARESAAKMDDRECSTPGNGVVGRTDALDDPDRFFDPMGFCAQLVDPSPSDGPDHSAAPSHPGLPRPAHSRAQR